jgi:hypothetical protein
MGVEVLNFICVLFRIVPCPIKDGVPSDWRLSMLAEFVESLADFVRTARSNSMDSNLRSENSEKIRRARNV